jgi:ABC-type antimicrobial peptide transport system permease subunit
MPAANQLYLAEVWGSQEVLKNILEACPSKGLEVAVVDVVLPLLAGNPLGILDCVQCANVFHRVVGFVQRKNPLNYFNELIKFLLVLSLVEWRTNIMVFRGAWVLRLRPPGW